MDYRTPRRPAPLIVVSSPVTALDRATGAVVWTYPIAGSIRRVAVDEQWLLLLDSGGKVHRLDIHTGALAGVAATGLGHAHAMLFDGDRYYVSNGIDVVALDRNGQEVWRRRAINAGDGLGGLAVPGQVIQPDYSH